MTETSTSLICRPWASLEDLPDRRPALDEDRWEGLLWAASELLWAMTGRQFSGGCESTVTLREVRHGLSGWYPAGWLPPAWQPHGVVGWDRGLRVVALPDPPITRIDALTLDGQPFTEYDLNAPAGHLRRTDYASWPVDGALTVSYRHGIPPPIGGKDCAVLLAVEMGKSFAGEGDCQLPKRIQTLTRENVTVGFHTDFSKVDTGIWVIDKWVQSVNPRGYVRRARVWSPDIRQARRT